jgi:thioredoxin reductase
MKADVLIVGAGPAGLAAALELRSLGVRDVLVVDREQQAGGVPRHCAHTGYGLRDLRRLMTGPGYARHYTRAAAAAGATIRTATTMTRLTAAGAGGVGAELTGADGIESVQADVVLLATGCRERPRAARLVPGSRPAGVLTTGELQQRVHLGGERLGGRAVIVGAEHVSFSAVVTLEHAGADVIALVTDLPRHQSLAAFRLGAQVIWHAPVWTRTSVTEILGRERVTAVRLRDDRQGEEREVPCDLVVFTGDWIPDNEHARLAGARMGPASLSPAVDTAMRTSLPRVFAAGNLVHPAETADVAALSGRHAAGQIAALLAGPARDKAGIIPVTVTDPLLWVSPGAVRVPGPLPPRGKFVLRTAAYAPNARLEVRQDSKLLYRTRTRLVPGRSISLEGRWITQADPAGGPISIVAG